MCVLLLIDCRAHSAAVHVNLDTSGTDTPAAILERFCELGTHSCHKNAICTATGLGLFECKVHIQ